MGVNGASTDLESLVWRQEVVDRPSHLASRPGGAASIDSAFSSSCRRVATKAAPLNLGSGPLGPHVKYTPVVIMILTFGQLHVVIP
jgi:hypothetical protein